MAHGKNMIGGELSATGTQKFRALNPSTGAPLDGDFVEATLAELDQALGLAARAFPVYRKIAPDQIAAFLERIGAEIVNLGPALVERTSAETGLPAARLEGERARTVGQLKMFGDLVRDGSWVDARIDRAIPDRKPLPKPDLRRMLVPIGPVAVFCASNFPLAFSVAGGDTASALAAGNPVVVKANRAHPGCAELVGDAIRRAIAACGLPPGVFSMIHGANHELNTRLVRHPQTRAAGFTGSLKGGRALLDAAASRPDPIPVYAEMGSVNPVFILPRALEERGDAIAEGLKGSVTLGNGQFCTKPGVVMAFDDPAFDRFTEKLKRLMVQQAPGTLLHPGILKSYDEGVKALGSLSTVVAKSATAADKTKTQAEAAVFETDAAHFLSEARLREEVFGPATLLVRCGTRDELEHAARAMEGHLTATIHGTDADLKEFAPLMAILEERVGRIVLNGFPTGVEVCPSMNHGGPYPATTDGKFTSVGTAAIYRFVRPVCYQNFPDSSLPQELRNKNARKIWRLVDSKVTQEDL
ncbi:MAG TPA: aldehyde dehydrogenase (NADP(+)) [Planctomycetota bacterium]|nr:aldehyde dehydrogenase (NADP(+)) [Planctomycetota bacterium]